MSPLLRSSLTMACGLLLCACGSTETSATTSPLPLDEAGVDAAEEEAAAPEAGPTLRTIQQRNVFGALDPANKLHDGDFELSGLDATQYPWFFLEQKMLRTGTECRSGLRCVKLAPGDFVAGGFVWPDTPYAEVSFWAKSPGDSCEQDAPGFIWEIASNNEPTPLGALTPAPQEGWCKYGDVVKVDPAFAFYTLALVRRHDVTGDVLFDAASLLPRTEPPTNLRSRRSPSERDASIIAEMRRRAPEQYPHRPPPREPVPVRNPTGRRTSVFIR